MIAYEHLEDDHENYSIMELIGRGAFGKVYKAVNNKTNEEAAVKVNL